MKNFLLSLFVLLTALSAKAWQISVTEDPYWLKNIKAKPSVFVEMNKYFSERNPNVDAKPYVETFIPEMHQRMIYETEAFFQNRQMLTSCSPLVEVTFPSALTTKFNFDSKNEFEKDFLKVESNVCLGKLDINKVFETLMSEDFQRKAINGLQNIQISKADNSACIKTKIFAIGTSNFCLTKQVLRTQNQYIIQSFNELNNHSPSLPVYFKESINVITQLPDGEISLYNLMYARGPDLSFRSIIRSKVQDQQEKVRRFLIEGAK